MTRYLPRARETLWLSACLPCCYYMCMLACSLMCTCLCEIFCASMKYVSDLYVRVSACARVCIVIYILGSYVCVCDACTGCVSECVCSGCVWVCVCCVWVGAIGFYWERVRVCLHSNAWSKAAVESLYRRHKQTIAHTFPVNALIFKDKPRDSYITRESASSRPCHTEHT